jgi:hypothetical protein
MEPSAADLIWQEGDAIHQLIKKEIHALHEQQRILRAQGRMGLITMGIVLLCIAVHVVLFFTLGDWYLPLFITASFYLYMVYFITLLIPLGTGAIGFPVQEIRKFFAALHRSGIIPTTDRLTGILLDIFFINSRTLFYGFSVIFSADLLFAFAGYFSGDFSTITVLVILFQVLCILVFYFCVWKFEPYSIRFHRDVTAIRGKLVAGKYSQRLVSSLFGIAAVFVLFVIIATIILLPGVTVKTLLSLTGFNNLSNPVILLGILLGSQYFIVRFFHGMSSARMAEQFSETNMFHLQSAQVRQHAELSLEDGPEADFGRSADALREAAGVLLEQKMFKVDVRTIGGAFPVFIVNPDFSVILDRDVLALITGFLGRAGTAES